MKVIIAGSRGISNSAALLVAIDGSGFEITEVVSGGAQGVDAMGEGWALRRCPVTIFKAAWSWLEAPGAIIKTRPDGISYNVKAGIDRNSRMTEYADALIAVWDGHSRGTKNMIEVMKTMGKPVYIHRTY